MSNRRLAWTRLLRAWKAGPASGLEEARRYTKSFPNDFGGWIVLADSLWTLARYPEATEALRRAERVVPSRLRPSIWENRGELYRAKNELVRAERWFRKALSAQPTTRRHIFLGATLARQGRLAEALTQHRAAIRLATPTEPLEEAHYNAALVLRALGRYEDSLRHAQEALRLNPRYALARQSLRDIQRVLRTGSSQRDNKRSQPRRAVAHRSRRG